MTQEQFEERAIFDLEKTPCTVYNIRTARWSIWLGRHPLKVEMTGSSPVRATIKVKKPRFAQFLLICFRAFSLDSIDLLKRQNGLTR